MMMKLSPLPNSLSKIRLQFFSSFSQISRKPEPNSLYRKISPIGDPSVSLEPLLDQWIDDGNSVNETMLRRIIHTLKNYKRFNHALQVSQWMTDKRYITLNYSDVAMRINLISRVHGLEQVEKYFADISQRQNSACTHLALLNCYSRWKSVDKADSLFKKAKDLGYVDRPAWYNAMINLHHNLGNIEKIDNLKHEMEERGIRPDQFTLHALLKAYTAKSDTARINSVLKILESDHGIIQNWSLLGVAATAYLKVGSPDKALLMLKKMEPCINGKEKDSAIRVLLLLYAKSGKKDEVYRIWNLYKEKNKVYNNIYVSMMSALLRLEDFDGVESLFKEWESSGLSYDFKIVNLVIDVYSRLGNLEKAEAVLNEGILRGGIPNVSTWCNLAGGYIMENKLDQAIDSLNKAISLCSRKAGSRLETLRSCLEYLGGGKSIDDFIKSINRKSVPPWFVLVKLLSFVKTGELSSCSGDSNGDVMTDDEMMH